MRLSLIHIYHLLTSTEALDLDQVPASVTVIGGGVIGVEFAYLLNRLGSKVTVLELMDHILPMVDTEVSSLAEKRMTKDGILFRLGAKVSRVKDDTVYYEYEGQECQVKSDIDVYKRQPPGSPAPGSPGGRRWRSQSRCPCGRR